MNTILFRIPDDNHDFSFNVFLAEIVYHLGQCSTDVLLVDFGEFARHAYLTVGAHHFHELLQGLYQAVRRFVEDGGVGIVGYLLDFGLTSFLMRQKTLEDEMVGGEA